jgi:hypothetical protein
VSCAVVLRIELASKTLLRKLNPTSANCRQCTYEAIRVQGPDKERWTKLAQTACGCRCVVARGGPWLVVGVSGGAVQLINSRASACR